MYITKETAILVISFGTSYEQTRKKTIEQIEKNIHDTYPDLPLYRAWTSPHIRRKLQERDHMHIMDIAEAMDQMHADGIRNVVIQPTYVITGFEYDTMKKEILKFEKNFDSVIICDSLIATQQDKQEICQALIREYHPASDEVLLFMGHGTEHIADKLYPELDRLFKEAGNPNIYMGTVEGNFSIESFLNKLKILNPSHIHLAPFMIVAGDHATNDMSGDNKNSWKSILEKGGYHVTCTLKGLGEFQSVRDIFIRHVETGFKQLSTINSSF